MDPCPFIRVTVRNLAVKLAAAADRPSGSREVHPFANPCSCELRLNKLPLLTSSLPLLPSDSVSPGDTPAAAAVFHLSPGDMNQASAKSSWFFWSSRRVTKAKLKVAIYSGRSGVTDGVTSRRLLGKVSLHLDLRDNAFSDGGARAVVLHSGWVQVTKISKGVAAGMQLCLTVRAESDPRFVFEFDGEPECSPQVLQLQGNMRQPMFTVKFSSCRNADLHIRSRSIRSESSKGWLLLSSFGSDRDRVAKERKGWSVTVHDLSGSPVALASMVMPFVASPGTDKVSRSSPGAWLILRPEVGSWKPWGRLEAWRESSNNGDDLGYRFELLLPGTTMGTGIPVAESSISFSKGGKFIIDLAGADAAIGRANVGSSPGCSPRGSGELGYHGLWPIAVVPGGGFVMSVTVQGEGRCSRPNVEVGVQHVGCAEDAAAFIALAAAVDLSVDACRPFSQKLRKELTRTNTSI